jgi:potassium efflux system protein
VPNGEPEEIELRVDSLEARLVQLQAAVGIDEARKAKLVEIYQQIIAELRRAAELDNKRAELMKSLHDAPAQIQALQTELAQPPPDPSADFSADQSLATLEEGLRAAEAAVAVTQEAVTRFEQELTDIAERRRTAPESIAASAAAMEAIRAELLTAPPEGEAAQVTEARRALGRARQIALESEIDRWETGIATYGLRSELLRLRAAKAARDLATGRTKVAIWQEAVTNQRRAEAGLAAAEAERVRREAALSHQVIKDLAERNAKLADERAKLVEKIKAITDQKATVGKLLSDVQASFEYVVERVKRKRLEHAMGLLLRRKRDELPDLRAVQRQAASRAVEIATSDVRMIELEDEQKRLADLEQAVREAVERVRQATPTAAVEPIEAEIRPLLVKRLELLSALLVDNGNYFDKLLELDAEEQELISKVTEYGAFIDERVLWIRSGSFPGPSDFMASLDAIRWNIDPDAWGQAWTAMFSHTRNRPGPVVAFVILTGLLLVFRRRFRSTVSDLGQQALSSSCVSMRLTFHTLLLTVLIAAVWPSVVWFIGWQFGRVPGAPDVARAVSAGLQQASLAFLTMEFYRQVCRANGLAEAHFGWPARSVRLFRRNLAWAMSLVVPLIFLGSTLEWAGQEDWRNSIIRLLFVTRMVVVTVFCVRILRPSTGIFAGTPIAAQTRGFNYLRHFWYPLGIWLPSLLALLALIGFVYTSIRMWEPLRLSMQLALTVILVRALATRWLLISRRRLAFDQLRKRREALAAQRVERVSGGESETEPPTEPELDVAGVSAQTRNLVRMLTFVTMVVGLWLVWVDVLPALGILNNYELWSNSVSVTESIPGPDGQPEVRTVDQNMPVRLGDLALALVVLGVTLAGTKNVPGLLEISVLQRLPLDAGARYAVTTVTRYTLTIVGVVIAFSMIGLGWSKVQWLAAAVTVGLGFGLQEIFANFVSGLIILFERPIRIGDIVTVGEVEGRVTRIRIRATTIMDWDRREMLVPNKEFITGRLLNWTLSDDITREVITVGVAYNSDIEKTRELLLKIAHDSPVVMKDPPPSAIMRRFADSAMEFDLRVFLASRDDWADLTHDVRRDIHREFGKAGIEIAFPQRDIHIRSIQGLPTQAPEDFTGVRRD